MLTAPAASTRRSSCWSKSQRARQEALDYRNGCRLEQRGLSLAQVSRAHHHRAPAPSTGAKAIGSGDSSAGDDAFVVRQIHGGEAVGSSQPAANGGRDASARRSLEALSRRRLLLPEERERVEGWPGLRDRAGGGPVGQSVGWNAPALLPDTPAPAVPPCRMPCEDPAASHARDAAGIAVVQADAEEIRTPAIGHRAAGEFVDCATARRPGGAPHRRGPATGRC